MNQVANVRWNGEHSNNFSVKNGCGQGKVLAAIAYCMYCEELFETLCCRHSGCWIGGYYRGIFGYSDDNWVMAPSLSALQDILKTCEEFAASHNLKFSTDPNTIKCKTKCMAFLSRPRKLQDMYLCGNPLPWVKSLVHLGTRVTDQIDGCQQDMKQKIASYIDRNCSINQEFHFAHPKLRSGSTSSTTVSVISLGLRSGTSLAKGQLVLKGLTTALSKLWLSSHFRPTDT